MVISTDYLQVFVMEAHAVGYRIPSMSVHSLCYCVGLLQLGVCSMSPTNCGATLQSATLTTTAPPAHRHVRQPEIVAPALLSKSSCQHSKFKFFIPCYQCNTQAYACRQAYTYKQLAIGCAKSWHALLIDSRFDTDFLLAYFLF